MLYAFALVVTLAQAGLVLAGGVEALAFNRTRRGGWLIAAGLALPPAVIALVWVGVRAWLVVRGVG
jgi:hypothetical protein